MSCKQHERPSGFRRWWRISLADAGFADEIVEIVSQLPNDRIEVRYLRDGCLDVATVHMLFACSPKLLAAYGLVNDYDPPVRKGTVV